MIFHIDFQLILHNIHINQIKITNFQENIDLYVLIFYLSNKFKSIFHFLQYQKYIIILLYNLIHHEHNK